MPENKLLTKSDLIFQNMFGKKGNEALTERLLSLILKRKIKGIDLDANKRLLAKNIDGKVGRLDVRAKLENGEDYNIEIQVAGYKYMAERMLYYWAQLYDVKLPKGKMYDLLKPTISILITAYEIEDFKEIENYHTVWNLREQTYTDKILTPNIELHILEMPKLIKSAVDTGKDELALWLKLINDPEEREILEMAEENDFLKQAMEEYKHLKGDPDFKRIVESREAFLRDQASYEKEAKEKAMAEGRAEGRAEGMAEGMAEGEKKSRKETAKKLKELGVEIEIIQKATDLTKEEIENL